MQVFSFYLPPCRFFFFFHLNIADFLRRLCFRNVVRFFQDNIFFFDAGFRPLKKYYTQNVFDSTQQGIFSKDSFNFR